MVIRNHIAYRFLTDDNLAMEIVEATHPNEFKKLLNNEILNIPDKIHSLYHLVCNKKQVPYIVTESVIKHLDLLKIKK